MSKSLNKFTKLFLIFSKIGLFSFGGGFAMIPLLKREIVDNCNFISAEELADVISLCESAPGSISVNMATFVGFRAAGFWGAASATFGVVIPSFIIIAVLSLFINAFRAHPTVRYAFYGIRIGVLSLIINAFLSIYKSYSKTLFIYLLMAVTFIFVTIFRVNAIYMLLICMVAGILKALASKEGI